MAFLVLGAASCAKSPPPAEPQHIPGTNETGESGESGAPPPVAETLPTPAEAESGRITARPHAPGKPDRVTSGEHRLNLGRGDRDGLVFVPASYDGSRPTPIMLLLHGATGNAAKVMRTFRERADQSGILLVVPDSRDDTTWDLVTQHAFGPDLIFIQRALALAFDRWNVDPARVYVAGWSDGASYALSLGLTNGDLFTAILAFSPGFAAPGDQTGKPRIFVSHGSHDHILPIARASGRMVPILEHNGYDVRYVKFDGDHEIPRAVLDAAFAWLAKH